MLVTLRGQRVNEQCATLQRDRVCTCFDSWKESFPAFTSKILYNTSYKFV